MIDCHTHTKYSPDSKTEPEAQILSAIEKGLSYICITEHMDFTDGMKYSLPGETIFTYEITPEYFAEYGRLRENYADKIQIGIGVEAGWTKEDESHVKEELAKNDFDYIINSIHLVDGYDIYWPSFYKGKTKKQAYEAYLNAVMESLKAPYRFDCVGHLGYITRYSVFEDKTMKYADYADSIDQILKEIIKRDILLEVNTHNIAYGLDIPDLTIAKRYYELGGRLLTVGSDAHRPVLIAECYKEAAERAKAIGFKNFVYKCRGKITEVPI